MQTRTSHLVLALSAALLLLPACSGSDEADDSLTRDRTLPPAPTKIVAAPPAALEVTPAAEDDADASVDAPLQLTSAETRPKMLVEDPARKGRAAWDAGDYAASARFLEAAVARGEAAPYDVYLLGLAHWKTGELVRAEAELVEATWSLQGFARAPLNLARIRLEQGDVAGAREAIDAALALEPDSAAAHNVRGRILLAKGDRDGANEAFRRSIELDPTNPWPRNNLGYLYLIREQILEAVGALEGAVDADPEMAEAWHNLALAREKKGDLAGAHAAAMAARELRPGSERLASTETRLAALVPEDSGEPQMAASTPVDTGEEKVSEEVVASLEK